MAARSLRDRLRARRSGRDEDPGRRPTRRVAVVGGDAAAAAALRRAGLEVVDDVTARGVLDAVVVLDPRARPADLPRAPLRLAVVARGEGRAWTRAGLALEDADGVLVGSHTDLRVVEGATVAAPEVLGVDAIADVLDRLEAAPRVHLVTGVSNLKQRHRWGDHHFALATARALSRAGWLPRTWCQAELADVDHGPADLGLLIAGKVALAPLPATPTLAWVISHPDALDGLDVTDPDGLGGLAHVHVASPTTAADLADAGLDASVLPQATDPARFHPTEGGHAHELLYVANSRNVRRRVVADLLPTTHELAVYGAGWTPELLDPRHLVADHLPNADLPAAYTAAGIVLNDHWDDMRTRGLLSNRLFDAAACGACVVTDDVAGLDEVFAGAITAYRGRDELRALVDDLLADPGRRRELGERAREVVTAGHTFDDRVARLLATAPVEVAP